MRSRSLVATLLLLLFPASAGAGTPAASRPPDPGQARSTRVSVTPVTPARAARRELSSAELHPLEAAVQTEPRERKARLELVRALMESGDLERARTEALAWREHDAYNLVAVRLLGDIEAERGDEPSARRTYSSIVELLPKDVEARRALATVLKQGGDLEGSRRQLEGALELRPEDRRIAFELGDVEQRLGRFDEARARFQSTADAPDADEALRFPAKQRLSQILQRDRRTALAKGDAAAAKSIEVSLGKLGLAGGLENDVKVFLSWDTDRTDVDLWVLTPSGEKVFYGHARGKGGEALFHDVTTGYGPESFTVHTAARGDYSILVNYFGARPGDFKEARGEVIVVTDEGRPGEHKEVLPYRLFQQGETVEVARVHVVGGAS